MLVGCAFWWAVVYLVPTGERALHQRALHQWALQQRAVHRWALTKQRGVDCMLFRCKLGSNAELVWAACVWA